MSRYGSGMREPPWVMGSPKEVMDWYESSQPSEDEKDEREIEKRFLNNLHIKFDFDVKRKEIDPPNFISKIIGRKYYEEDFELFPTAELILRGLAKAKFKNTARILIDKKVLYDHPENKTDLRDTIKTIKDFSDDIKNGKNLEIDAIHSDAKKAKAIIKISKIHSSKNHSVDIRIEGKIMKDVYHTFINYLKDNIGLKKSSD